MSTSQLTRKEKILFEAAELFRQKGYAASTMRDLAEKVGIEAASLYNHIKSKGQLLSEICFSIGKMFTTEMDKIVGSESTAAQKLEAVIRLHVQITTVYASMATVANQEWRHLSEPQLSYFVQMRTQYEQQFLEIIKSGIRSGELHDHNATITLYTVLSSMRWLQYWYREDRNVTVEQLQTEIVELLMKGLRK